VPVAWNAVLRVTAANGPRLPGQLAGTIRRSTADGRGELDETDVWPQQKRR